MPFSTELCKIKETGKMTWHYGSELSLNESLNICDRFLSMCIICYKDVKVKGFEMVKNSNNDDLAKKKVDPKYYLLYQLWKELTAKKTLDTYQFRIMNSLSALKELIKVVRYRLKRYHNSNHNIEECKAETREIIKNDLILNKYYPVIRSRLLSHLNEKTDTDSQQRVLLYQIEYAVKMLEPQYFERLLDDLKENVDNHIVSSILQETNQVISCCADRGWSNEALYDIITMLCGSKNEPSLWEKFRNRLCGTEQDEYHILLPFKIRAINVPGQKNEAAKERVLDEIRRMGIETITSEEMISRYSCLARINVEANQIYLLLQVPAYDMYSASHLAISEIANTFNILSFYNLTEPWSIRDISWLVVNIKNLSFRAFRSKDLYSTYDYLEGAGKIFRSSKELDKNADQSVKAKLQAAYSYANMGKVSYAQTEKYMNCWIALESLCRTEMYENIIENILETVPPALCLRYIYRCFRNFAEDCVRCGINFKDSDIPVNLKNPSKGKMVEDIIAVMNNENLYQKLLEKCSVNELLAERCKEMYSIAVDGNKMVERIDRHYTNVRRQLSRLYRLRNEIAHSALHNGGSLIRYIEHLDDYLLDFVAEVVMCWEKNPQNSIENIFEIIKDNFREYSDIKSAKKGANPLSLLNSLRKTGIISLI